MIEVLCLIFFFVHEWRQHKRVFAGRKQKNKQQQKNTQQPTICVVYRLTLCCSLAGVFGVVYDGYLSNAEDDPEGTTPVIIKTVKGKKKDGKDRYFTCRELDSS